MKKKICSKCKKNLPIDRFSKDKCRFDGLCHKCKICTKQYKKQYYLKNKEKILQKGQKYWKKNKDKLSKQNKIWRDTHKKYCSDYSLKYRKNHKLQIAQKDKEYAQKHKLKKKQYLHNYLRLRLLRDLNFKLRKNLRTRIWKVLNENTKSAHTSELLGCSIEFLKKHLESLFKPGMSWDNYGTGWNGKGMREWHVDHIEPCASFDLSKPSEQRKCFHYTNLQPLWAEENRKKRDHILMSKL